MGIYLVLVLSSALFVTLKGSRVLSTLFAVDLGAGPLETGILFAMNGLFPFLLSVHAGRIADRFDNRVLIYCGIGGCAACMLLPFLFPVLPVLFVSGGSSGARTINLAVAGAAKKLSHAGVQVLHVQGGRNDPFDVPSDLPVPYVVVPYLSDMQLGYAAGDLMLCRGGAITVAETTAVGMPALYVPYPHSNQEQKRNALPVVEAGGGLLVDNAELTPEWIERTIIPLTRDPQRLAAMGAAAGSYGRRDGDEALLDFVCEAVARR